ncbi:spore cortex-lytic enzyme-like [Culicoides brevitarsis]|uniref:spore cortex-lytic enzyme-like n=1 Tax=Culicoides brevitarsis TaxID=469753 RepID=UPI00307B103F
MSSLGEMEVFAKTVYMEARGEIPEGRLWVAWVIKNRAADGRFGGRTIKEVCLHKDQFECWNNCTDTTISEPDIYRDIWNMCERVYNSSLSQDPTGGCVYYNNPDKENPDWAHRVRKIRKIGNHQFYKE